MEVQENKKRRVKVTFKATADVTMDISEHDLEEYYGGNIEEVASVTVDNAMIDAGIYIDEMEVINFEEV